MRFSIAAGILAVSLPSQAHVSRMDGTRDIKASSEKDGLLGSSFGPNEETNRFAKKNGFGGRQQGNRRLGQMKNRGLLLKNQNNDNAAGAGGKECKPASFDADVGVLGCGVGQYCQESQDSKLGGICAPSTQPLELVSRNLDQYENITAFEFISYYNCDKPECDCSNLDTSTMTGTIECGPTYSCYEECEPSLQCTGLTLTYNLFGADSYTESACNTYLYDSVDRTICFNSDYTYTYNPDFEPIAIYMDGVQCANFSYSEKGECVLFDCTNTPANIGSTSCDDGVNFLPDTFYDNCTYTTFPAPYECSPCVAGLYTSIPDGMVAGYTCADIEFSGQAALISPDNCALLTPLFAANCGCEPLPVPENDLCMNAVPLEASSGKLFQGTNTGATLDEVPRCFEEGTDSLQGVWYTITGDDTEIVVSLCEGNTEVDTRIDVFQGSCDDLVCIGGNDDSCGLASAYGWFAEAGVEYYVLVHGFGGRVVDFTISSPAPTPSPTTSPTTSLSPSFSPPDNDMCDGAVLLGIIGGDVLGTTLGATSDLVPSCFFDGQVNLDGVWYVVMGSDEWTSVDVCEGLTIDTVINLYEGVSCGDLFCIDANDDGTSGQCGEDGRGSALTFFAARGKTYYIMVRAYSGTENGDFRLRLGTSPPPPPPPENDVCDSAVPLVVNGEPLSGSTVTATTGRAPSCFSDGSLTAFKGVWYSLVVGGDTDVVVHLCDEGTTFDTKITIYEGSSCGDLVCVGNNDDGQFTNLNCGLVSAFGGLAEAGKTYYIAVHGHSFDSVGDFVIRAVENDGNFSTEPIGPILCPGQPSYNFCDCEFDCVNQPQWCQCAEAQACCGFVVPDDDITSPPTNAPSVLVAATVAPTAADSASPTLSVTTTITTTPPVTIVDNDAPTVTPAGTPEPTPEADEPTSEPTVEDDGSGSSSLSMTATCGVCAFSVIVSYYFMG